MDDREKQGRKADVPPAGDEALLRFLQQESGERENAAGAEEPSGENQTPAEGAPAGRAQDLADHTFVSFEEPGLSGGASAPSGSPDLAGETSDASGEGPASGGTAERTANAEGARAFSDGTFASFEPERGSGPVRTPRPPQKERSALGTVSLVLGIVGVVCCCMMPPVGIAAIVCAIIARSRDGSFSGVSLAGLILGILVTVVGAAALVSWISAFIMFWEEGIPVPPEYDGWEENVQEQIRALRLFVCR